MRAFYLLRAGLLYVLLTIGVTIWCWPVIFCAPFPFRIRFRVASVFLHYSVFLLRVLVGIRQRVSGLENIPNRPMILLVKHQSMWETLVFMTLFPPYCWVLKRGLMWVPVLGWGVNKTNVTACTPDNDCIDYPICM